jgi:hypothetical protein
MRKEKEKEKVNSRSSSLSSVVHKRNNEKDNVPIRQEIKPFCYDDERDDRPSILEPNNSINTLSALTRQGVFLNGMTHEDFIFYYYPQIKKVIGNDNEKEWYENSSPEAFIEWMLTTLDKYIPVRNWIFKNGCFDVIVSFPFDGEGHGFSIGGYYDLKKIDKPLYDYAIRVFRTWTQYFNYLHWDGDEAEGSLDYMLEQIVEMDTEDAIIHKKLYNLYKKGNAKKMKSDIYNAKEITVEESFKKINHFKKTRNHNMNEILDWLHQGVTIVQKELVEEKISFVVRGDHFSNLLDDSGKDDSEKLVPGTQFFSFVFNVNDPYFEFTDQMFSETIGNYGYSDFKLSVPYYKISETKSKVEKTIQNISDWFIKGCKIYEREPGTIKETKSSPEHTLLHILG